ncbi:hypothetical protein J6590_065435, partial [Homalodisca vitripennis]
CGLTHHDVSILAQHCSCGNKKDDRSSRTILGYKNSMMNSKLDSKRNSKYLIFEDKAHE